jgi:hypothetical protein
MQAHATGTSCSSIHIKLNLADACPAWAYDKCSLQPRAVQPQASSHWSKTFRMRLVGDMEVLRESASNVYHLRSQSCVLENALDPGCHSILCIVKMHDIATCRLAI